jgi:nucleoside-diphosphate-sugar epimerase
VVVAALNAEATIDEFALLVEGVRGQYGSGAMSSAGTVVLVTGGGGFIGSHLADRLCRDGHRVRVLDNFATGRRENLLHLITDIELIEGDIQSYERVHNAVRGSELVFHAAALPSVPRSVQDPLTSNASNVTGTLNVLLASRDEGVRRVVFASSSSVYGANRELPKREDMPAHPIAPYAVAKLAAEGYCRAFFDVYGLETVSLRYFNVFGPRQDPVSQYAAVIPSFITALIGGQSPVVYGDGEQSRDFTYVDNAVEASLLAADADGVAGETFNVACGERTTLNEVLETLRDLSGSREAAEYGDPRPGDVAHSLADISRARERLGYEPGIDVRRGLELTYQHIEGKAIERHPAAA